MQKLCLTNEANQKTESQSSEPSWFTAAKQNVAKTQKTNELKKELGSIALKEEKIKKIHERARVAKKALQSDRKPDVNKPKNARHKLKPETEVEKDDDDDLLLEEPRDDSDCDVEEDCEEMVKNLLQLKTRISTSR